MTLQRESQGNKYADLTFIPPFSLPPLADLNQSWWPRESIDKVLISQLSCAELGRKACRVDSDGEMACRALSGREKEKVKAQA